MRCQRCGVIGHAEGDGHACITISGMRYDGRQERSGAEVVTAACARTIEPTEEQVSAAAKVIADSPLIDAPKLAAVCWRGLARSVLLAAHQGNESAQPCADGDSCPDARRYGAVHPVKGPAHD